MGAHQFAKQFAGNGYEVAFISEPISSFHYFFALDKEGFWDRHRYWLQGGRWEDGGKVWAYTPFALVPITKKPLFRSRWIVDNNYKLAFPPLKWKLKKAGFHKVDVLFLDEPFEYFLDNVDYGKSVFRLSENIVPLFEKDKAHLLEKAKRVVRRADLVVITARQLQDLAQKMGARRIEYIPGGADFELFNDGFPRIPQEYGEIPAPRVVFVGNINYWLDVELLAYAARRLPDVSFILIGKPWTDITKLDGLPNIHFLGGRCHGDLPPYLKHADIGMIPFNTKILRTRYVHPIKLYEYMSCGLPVVSTSWPELKAMNSPVYAAETKEEFVRLLLKAQGEKGQPRFIEYAQANTWPQRYEKLIQALASV